MQELSKNASDAFMSVVAYGFLVGMFIYWIIYKICLRKLEQERRFRFGDECRIGKLGRGAFHFEARREFKGKRIVFVKYGISKFVGNGFIACILRLSEDICTNNQTQEYMLSGHEFYFPCVKLKKPPS